MGLRLWCRVGMGLRLRVGCPVDRVVVRLMSGRAVPAARVAAVARMRMRRLIHDRVHRRRPMASHGTDFAGHGVHVRSPCRPGAMLRSGQRATQRQREGQQQDEPEAKGRFHGWKLSSRKRALQGRGRDGIDPC